MIKILAGIDDVLSGKLLVMDLLNMDDEKISFSNPNDHRKINCLKVKERLRNYRTEKNDIQEISARDLSSLINASDAIS